MLQSAESLTAIEETDDLKIQREKKAAAAKKSKELERMSTTESKDSSYGPDLTRFGPCGVKNGPIRLQSATACQTERHSGKVETISILVESLANGKLVDYFLVARDPLIKH